MASIFDDSHRRYFLQPGAVPSFFELSTSLSNYRQQLADAERLGFVELVPVPRLLALAARLVEGGGYHDAGAELTHLLDELTEGPSAFHPPIEE